MPISSIPDIYKSPALIQQVIDDLELVRSGVKLCFAVDPSEIVDFCFPINPSQSRVAELNRIADDQAALYEILYIGKPAPLLLPEYIQEIQRDEEFLIFAVSGLYDRAQVLDEFARNLDLEQYRGVTKEQLIDLVGEDFHLLLAVAMGIFSFGADRFQTVRKRLVAPSHLGKPFADISSSYKKTPAADIVYRRLLEDFERPNQQDKISPLEKERRRQSARVDVGAVDRIIHLNRSLQQAYDTGTMKERRVVLYLSSAPRTAHILKLFKEECPKLWATTYPFWRTREQVFARIIHRARKSTGEEDISKTIRNLRSFRKTAAKIERLDRLSHQSLERLERCDSCILNGGDGDSCSRQEFCEAVRRLDRSICMRREEIKNLGLAAGIRTYHALLTSTPQGKEKDYLEIFRKIYDTAHIRDLALAKLFTLQSFSVTQSESTFLLARGLSVPQQHAGPGDITGAMQRLPVRPDLKSVDYKIIMDYVIEYYKTPLSLMREKSNVINEAYRLFVIKDSEMKQPTGDHELVRCFLYLALPYIESDERALEHAKRSKETFAELTKEFNYLIIWAARILGKFALAEDTVQESIAKFPEDARPYHGRALNIIAWLNDAKQRAGCPFGLREAIAAVEEAIRLYGREEGDAAELIGVCYNDLAYLLSYDRMDDSYNVVEARAALDQLKKYVNKDTWDPFYPEYLHTEAQVEYQEFLQGFMTGQSKASLKIKLDYAKRDLEAAIRLCPKAYYLALRDQIDNALQRVRL